MSTVYCMLNLAALPSTFDNNKNASTKCHHNMQLLSILDIESKLGPTVIRLSSSQHMSSMASTCVIHQQISILDGVIFSTFWTSS